VDPAAPFGRKPNGQPYQRDPKQYQTRSANQRKRQGATAPRPRKSSSGDKAMAVDYRPAVAGLLSIPTAMLAVGATVNKSLALDAMAVSIHTPAIASAVNELALSDDRVAAVLDKLLAVGPYGALFGALLPLGMQIAANHGMMPARAEFGTLPPDKLAELAEQLQ